MDRVLQRARELALEQHGVDRVEFSYVEYIIPTRKHFFKLPWAGLAGSVWSIMISYANPGQVQ